MCWAVGIDLRFFIPLLILYFQLDLIGEALLLITVVSAFFFLLNSIFHGLCLTWKQMSNEKQFLLIKDEHE